MIRGELKSKVDRILDTPWSGGIASLFSVIEQLTWGICRIGTTRRPNAINHTATPTRTIPLATDRGEI